MENDIENPTPAIVPDGAHDAEAKVVAALNTQMYLIAALHQICELRADTIAEQGIIRRVIGWNRTRTTRKDVIDQWEAHIVNRDTVIGHIYAKVKMRATCVTPPDLSTISV